MFSLLLSLSLIQPAPGCHWIGKVIVCPDIATDPFDPPGNPAPTGTGHGATSERGSGRIDPNGQPS